MRKAGTLRRQVPTTKATPSCRPSFFHNHSIGVASEAQSNGDGNEAKPVRRVADLEAGLALL